MPHLYPPFLTHLTQKRAFYPPVSHSEKPRFVTPLFVILSPQYVTPFVTPFLRKNKKSEKMTNFAAPRKWSLSRSPSPVSWLPPPCRSRHHHTHPPHIIYRHTNKGRRSPHNRSYSPSKALKTPVFSLFQPFHGPSASLSPQALSWFPHAAILPVHSHHHPMTFIPYISAYTSTIPAYTSIIRTIYEHHPHIITSLSELYLNYTNLYASFCDTSSLPSL